MAKYRVLRDISTRASADPESPDFERWLDFEAGTEGDLPKHVDVERLIASGHLERVKRAKEADHDEG